MHHARSALFVPGDRSERFIKALSSGADYVIIDLEDAVEEARKSLARESIQELAQMHPQYRFLVRINAPDHPQHEIDIEFCENCPSITGIVLPKTETAEQIAHVRRTGKAIWPIIESARGLAHIATLAQSPGIARLCLGTVDLSLDLGLGDGPGADTILDQARYSLLVHSKANSLSAPLDGVFVALDDQARLRQAAQRSMAMGFAGMLCLHPKQIPTIHQAWQPTEEAIAWARKVISAANQIDAGAFKLDGYMIDAPVLARAHDVLSLAELGGS